MHLDGEMVYSINKAAVKVGEMSKAGKRDQRMVHYLFFPTSVGRV